MHRDFALWRQLGLRLRSWRRHPAEVGAGRVRATAPSAAEQRDHRLGIGARGVPLATEDSASAVDMVVRATVEMAREAEHVGIADHVAIDPGTLAELRSYDSGGATGMFRELLTLFLQGADQHLADMRTACAEGSGDRLAREAHALKGSAGVLGAETLRLGCHEIELFGQRGDLAGAEALIEAAAREIQLVRAQLEDEMALEMPLGTPHETSHGTPPTGRV